jgi:D-lactate dehydrogenase (cytochrome)
MRRDTATAIALLRDRFGEQFSTSDAVRRHHATGVTAHRTEAPDAVLFARSTADVVDAVRICREHECPVIPFGTGTSTEGQISAEQGGLTIDMSGMDRILRVSSDDLDCSV